jgi:predicted nucleotidyltransferase
MRLTADQQITIKNIALSTLGPQATVRVFGSRLQDNARGGDIDLLFETPALLPRKAAAICQLYAALIMALGDQKIDVLLKDARPSTASVIDHAQRTGLLL